MQVTITAVGPDNRGLADPIIHHVSALGANIFEIQMYDHDSQKLFAMLLRIDWPGSPAALHELRAQLQEIGRAKSLSVRVWSREELVRPPRLAICTTFRTEPPQVLLAAMRGNTLHATPAVIIGNRAACEPLAKQYSVPFHNVGNDEGIPDSEQMTSLFDQYHVDYIILARFMRVLPARSCWQFAGRIINLHHGLLPAFPTVQPGTPLEQIKKLGETEHEPQCLVEGVRRVVNQEVALHFHRVVRP